MFDDVLIDTYPIEVKNMMKMTPIAMRQTIRAMIATSSAPAVLNKGFQYRISVMRGAYSRAITVIVTFVLVPRISWACTAHTYTPASLVLA